MNKIVVAFCSFCFTHTQTHIYIYICRKSISYLFIDFHWLELTVRWRCMLSVYHFCVFQKNEKKNFSVYWCLRCLFFFLVFTCTFSIRIVSFLFLSISLSLRTKFYDLIHAHINHMQFGNFCCACAFISFPFLLVL